VAPEICSRTDGQTHRQTDRSAHRNYFATAPAGEVKTFTIVNVWLSRYIPVPNFLGSNKQTNGDSCVIVWERVDASAVAAFVVSCSAAAASV